MALNDTIRVILLADEFSSAKILMEQCRSWTDIDFFPAETVDRVAHEMEERGGDVLAIESSAINSAEWSEVLSTAAEASPEIPVIVLGADGEDGADAVRFLELGAADYLPLAHLDRLPLVLRRVMRDKHILGGHSRLQEDLRNSYRTLRENQKLIAMGRLAASIAHEINNPLESVTNLLYLLRSDPDLSESSESYLKLAERELDRVVQISKETLNFYRETRTPTRVKPADLLEEVLVLYSRRIQERRIRVVRQFRSDESVLVFPGEMRQVFSNLVTNAIEASSGGGTLTLRVRGTRKWSDEGIRGIRILIGDSGSGIDAETRRRLGQLFYTTKGQRGTGLGLWVTREIVVRYGGDLQLYSSTGAERHGSVFSIFLPTNLRPHVVTEEPGAPNQSRLMRTEPRLGSHRSVIAEAASQADFAHVSNAKGHLLRKRNPLAAS